MGWKKAHGQLGSSAAPLVTVGATTIEIKSIEVHSVHTADVIFEFWDVPNSGGSVGTAGDTTRKWKDSIAPGKTILLPGSATGAPLPMLLTNDTYQGKASVASVINYTIIYWEN